MINICKTALLATFVLSMTGAIANPVSNPGFEVTSNKKSNRTWRAYPAEDWTAYVGVETKRGSATLTADRPFAGKYSLRLTCPHKQGTITSVASDKKFEVSPGSKLEASAMIRGQGKGYIRIYWFDKNGKKLPKYHMQGRASSAKWQRLATLAEVPETAVSAIISLEVLVEKATVDFDDVQVKMAHGAILNNGKIKAVINPALGGVIDSINLVGSDFQFTRPNQIGKHGGLFSCIIPAKRVPGLIRNTPAEYTVTKPGQEIVTSQKISTAQYPALELRRTYSLAPGETSIKVRFEFINHSKKAADIDWRIQSYVSTEPGYFSWPTPDWLQVFHQTGEPLNNLNSFVNDLLRTGWQARSYDKQQNAIRFTYDIKRSNRAYNYVMADYATMEWYYRPVTIAPGKSFVTDCSVDIISGQKKFYADAHAAKQRVEYIRPMQMPAPPDNSGLPERVRNTFLFAGGLGNLIPAEMGGLKNGSGQTNIFCKASMRLARVLTDNYFNNVGSVRITVNPAHEKFYGKDGKHQLGEFLRKHHMYFSLGRMLYHRRDIDVKEYRKRLPKILKDWEAPHLQKFAHQYKDRMLYVNTGDEPLAANVEIIMAAHDSLHKIMPKDVPLIVILNSSTVELMPYMPIFYADFYPIKRTTSSGANPWSVYPEFADKVKRAGDKPVWYMPPAFMSGPYNEKDIYAYPTSGELRLMVNLAVAAGVKGISWYGIASSTSPWVINYFHLRLSPLSCAGLPEPGWDGIVDCARELAGVGALLTRCKPAAVPANAVLECGNFNDPNGFYKGKAIRLFALKSPRGMVLAAVNQNPNANERGTLTISGKGWDFNELRPLTGNKIALDLVPGGVKYIYLGSDDAEIDLVCHSRYVREAARYKLAAERANGNGIATIDPDKFTKLPGRQALSSLNAEFAKLNKAIAASPLGKVMEDIEFMRRFAGQLDFDLTRDLELLITPEMAKATPRYGRWVKHPDQKVQQIKDALLDDYRKLGFLTDALAEGGNAAKLAPEVSALRKKLVSDAAAIREYMKSKANSRERDNLR